MLALVISINYEHQRPQGALLYGGRRRKGADITAPFANHDGAVAREVDDRGRSHAAITTVQDHIDTMFEPLVDFLGIGARVFFAG